MTDSEKIDFLGGEVDVLLTFVSAVIRTHADPGALQRAYMQSRELQAASTPGAPASKAFVHGQEQIRERLKALFLSAAPRRDT